ncbi:hypothetical protein TEA_013324 [Camellia sinensis var. sinensis]|uniref:AMP-activated protein kinase glycogen-binding domain-containing protein n=1 Tax=Camellia sinensis var. sinensis TaxID=542762 RepID=A0A4S4DS59_CAMSN|nr:hypothetical protein TEA_013324 [Camellia sinensis var. sinensis]
MASLFHFPSFFSPSSHKLFPLHSLHTDHTLHHIHRHDHSNPTIFASSIKKHRASRKVRSNADLCNDIREFLSVAGFPDGHVPSMKELSRSTWKVLILQDLANIIRRRGYKLIKELLAISTKSDGKGSDPEEVLVEKQDISGKCEHESTGPGERVGDMTEDASSSSEVSVKQNDLNSANGENNDYAFSSDSKSCMAIESSTNSSLQEKVAKFIQNGKLDAMEDDGFGILNEIAANNGKKFVESEDVTKELSSFGQDVSPLKQVVLHTSGKNTSRNDYFSSERLFSGDHEDLDVETIKMENQTEVDHLKFMLHQKELELSRLKEQVEKEKHTLSILQTKAETEISKAQELIMEKDAELHAAEESLSGLEEVEVQYRGDGEAVELAGSFNGWHHRITMDPQPSSSILDAIGSRRVDFDDMFFPGNLDFGQQCCGFIRGHMSVDDYGIDKSTVRPVYCGFCMFWRKTTIIYWFTISLLCNGIHQNAECALVKEI